MVINCQRPVFSLAVSQLCINCENFDSMVRSSCKKNDDRKKTLLLNKIVCFHVGIKGFWPQVFYLFFKIFFHFSEKLPRYVTSEGVVFHNVLYYQQLFVARYRVSFYAYWPPWLCCQRPVFLLDVSQHNMHVETNL